jgi:glucose uptake protein
MFIIENYSLAILFCFITMLCWGSWGNTQKLAGKTWRYELFYWDYTIGILLFAVIMAFTLGSIGNLGRSFIDDIQQVECGHILNAFIGGVIFNASNILLAASVSIAGMAVAFPLGVGLALVLGVFINYFSTPKGDPILLFIGVALIVIAIICNGIASGKNKNGTTNQNVKKGIWLATVAGILMSFFYRFVASAMDLNNFEYPAQGLATPYTALFIFSIGIFISNFLFNTLVMKKPFVGERVTYKQYFSGNFGTHLVGVFGGCVWALGTLFSYIAAGKAGAPISYALGQGAPMIAALWGVFVWKEFTRADKSINKLLAVMFLFFIAGLSLIVLSGGN